MEEKRKKYLHKILKDMHGDICVYIAVRERVLDNPDDKYVQEELKQYQHDIDEHLKKYEASDIKEMCEYYLQILDRQVENTENYIKEVKNHFCEEPFVERFISEDLRHVDKLEESLMGTFRFEKNVFTQAVDYFTEYENIKSKGDEPQR